MVSDIQSLTLVVSTTWNTIRLFKFQIVFQILRLVAANQSQIRFWFRNMSSASYDDDENGTASTMGTSEVSGPSSTGSSRKRKSMSGSVFKAWSLQLTVNADLGHGTTAEEKVKLLTEHLSTRTGHTLPSSVTCMAVFCDKSLLSVPPDSAGLVSIALQGYAQARYARRIHSNTATSNLRKRKTS